MSSHKGKGADCLFKDSTTAERTAFPMSNGLLVRTGMTLHQYFAGQALAGLASAGELYKSLTYEEEAQVIMLRADALCAAYDKRAAEKRGAK